MEPSRWTSRKFWVAMGVALLATLLLIGGAIDQMVWKDVVAATVFAYLASQGVVDAAGKIKKDKPE